METIAQRIQGIMTPVAPCRSQILEFRKMRPIEFWCLKVSTNTTHQHFNYAARSPTQVNALLTTVSKDTKHISNDDVDDRSRTVADWLFMNVLGTLGVRFTLRQLRSEQVGWKAKTRAVASSQFGSNSILAQKSLILLSFHSYNIFYH